MGRVTGSVGRVVCDAEGCTLTARYLVGGGAAAEFAYCEAHAVNLCACDGYYLAPGVDVIPDDGLNGQHTRGRCTAYESSEPSAALRVSATRHAEMPGGSLMHSRARS